LLPAFVASSPRVVAEFLNAMGYTASKIDAGLSLLKDYKAAVATNAVGRISKSQNPAGNPKQKSIMLKPLKLSTSK
jgi:hypothetical protein